MDGFQVVYRLCDVAVVLVSEIFGDKCAKPVSVYGHKGCREGRESQDACDVAGHFADRVFCGGRRSCFGVDFELYRMALLGKLTNGLHSLGVD